MASREIDSRIKIVYVFNIIDLSATATVQGDISIDTFDFESVEFAIFTPNTPLYVDGTFVLFPKHGDTNVPAEHVVVPDDELTQGVPLITGANQFIKVGYFGKKRFVSCEINASVATGAPVGAVIIFNTPRHSPTALNP